MYILPCLKLIGICPTILVWIWNFGLLVLSDISKISLLNLVEGYDGSLLSPFAPNDRVPYNSIFMCPMVVVINFQIFW